MCTSFGEECNTVTHTQFSKLVNLVILVVYFDRGLLDCEEMKKLRAALESDEGILKHTYGVGDGTGRQVIPFISCDRNP